MTNRIANTIPATGEEIAKAICVAADGTIRQSLGQGQPSPPCAWRSGPPHVRGSDREAVTGDTARR